MFTHTHIHTHTNTLHTHAHTNTPHINTHAHEHRTHTQRNTHTYTHSHTHTHTAHSHKHTNKHTYIHRHTHTYTHTHTHAHTHTYTHTYTHRAITNQRGTGQRRYHTYPSLLHSDRISYCNPPRTSLACSLHTHSTQYVTRSSGVESLSLLFIHSFIHPFILLLFFVVCNCIWGWMPEDFSISTIVLNRSRILNTMLLHPEHFV